MVGSLTARHLPRYGDMAQLLVRHGRRLLGEPGDERDVEADAERLAADLETHGPTFVKLGQLLSTRADLLPPEYLGALARLQDRVEPFGFADVERIVAGELGVRLSKAFREFDDVPLASASLGQVHIAVLRDGRPVVVKVQRPDVRDRVVEDMEVIAEIAAFADKHTGTGRQLGFCDMVEEFRRSLMAELDYRREAQNLRQLRRALQRFERIVVPAPVDDYSTERVLTMDRLAGRNVATLGPLAQLDVDGAPLADELFAAYLHQILVEGFFHADPHPGNVLLVDDGRLGLVDVGMVARVAPDMQDELVRLLLAVAEGRGREAADVLAGIGQPQDGFDRERFGRDVAELVTRNRTASMRDLAAGAVVGELARTSAAAGLRAPSELTMLGKALLNLDEVARRLDPAFRPNEALERHVGSIMRHKMLRAASPAGVLSAAMDAKEFAERLPGRINKVMDALAEGQLTLNVQGVDEAELMRGIQKLANRVAMAVVVAALIVGAAMIMRIETSATLFGYPTLAIVLFLVAALCGLGLVGSIVVSDLPQKRRRRRAS